MDKWLNKKSMTQSQEEIETILVSTFKKRKLNYDEPSTSSSESKQKKKPSENIVLNICKLDFRGTETKNIHDHNV